MSCMVLSHFIKRGVKAGIKPIIGLELSVASDNHVETKMILLAKSEKG
ncbi:hypothetical protein KHA80_16295 [Anaerobacillus sp. HL2]|nr:hypothetical protein KHA80_16295 [Anaerobacillus sp. HL2]